MGRFPDFRLKHLHRLLRINPNGIWCKLTGYSCGSSPGFGQLNGLTRFPIKPLRAPITISLYVIF